MFVWSLRVSNLNVDGKVRRAPFTLTVIQGHNTSLIAPTPQWQFGKRYVFVSWSDGGGRLHNVTAGARATYPAKYVQRAG